MNNLNNNNNTLIETNVSYGSPETDKLLTEFYKSSFFLPTLIFFCISSILDVVFLIFMKKKSQYISLFRKSIFAEAIYIWAYMARLIELNEPASKFFEFMNVPSKINFFFNFSVETYSRQVPKLNISLFHSAMAFSFLMHIFILIELIFMLKNPIGSVKLRKKVYYSISWIVSLALFVYNFIIYVDPKDSGFEDRSLNHISVFINFGLFVIILFLGMINLIYMIKRLGCNNFMKGGYYNKFLLRQILLFCFYSTFIIPFFVEAGARFFLDRYLNVYLNIYLFSLLGFVLFFIRITETNFYNYIKKCFKYCFAKEKSNESTLNLTNTNDNTNNETKNEAMEFFFNDEEPLTNMLSKMMNLEFICCILYGLNGIYNKDKKRNSNLKGETTTFTFKLNEKEK